MRKLLLILLFPLSYINGRDTTVSTKSPVTQHSILSNINCKEEIEYYRVEINHAVDLLKTERKLIDLELNKNERIDIISIAFPEIIRYNSFSDYIETSTNRILYINKGKKVSDFSTGYLQMKPSFVEDLENYVNQNESLKEYNSILIDKKLGKDIRKERINRLESFQWQIRYLKVLWYVLEEKYKNTYFRTKQDKIRFYATAYNYGFTKPEKEITNYQTVKIFPYGKGSSMPKFTFADFSIDFINSYQNLFN